MSSEKRLHPVAMLVGAISTLRRWISGLVLPGVVLLVSQAFSLWTVTLFLLGLIVVAALAALWGYLSWRATTYAVTGNSFRLQPEGVAGDRVGRRPPGEITPERRQRRHDDEAEQEECHRPQAERLAHKEDYAGENQPADPAPKRTYGSDEHGHGMETLLRAHPAPWSTRRCGLALFRRQGWRARVSGSVRPRCKRPRSRARTAAAVVPA